MINQAANPARPTQNDSYQEWINVVLAPNEILPADQLGRIHFVGIGGVEMAPLARIMVSRGLPVTGSDIVESATVKALQELGATVVMGQAPENLDGVDTVVVATDMPKDNVEVVDARRRGLRMMNRAAALASLMPGTRAVAVVGTQGRTMTTSMIATALRHVGADPSFIIGGELTSTGERGYAGKGDVLVAEANGIFPHAPHVAVITHMELDHSDHHASVAQTHEEFAKFAEQLTTDGILIVCIDDEAARKVAEATTARGVRVLTYGTAEGADVRVTEIGTVGGFPIFRLRGPLGAEYEPVSLSIPGRYNALNSAGAFTVALGLGYEAEPVLESLSGFGGVRRRMEFKGEAKGIRVYDDSSHHPTDVDAALTAARDLVGNGRVIVAFQTHHFHNHAILREFGPVLGAADAVVVLEAFSHGDGPIPDVTAAVVAAETGLPTERSFFEPNSADVAQRLSDLAESGDVVVTIGVGDLTRIGPEFLSLLGS